MKINFPTINFPRFNNMFNINYQNYIKPLQYDTFERINFQGKESIDGSPNEFEVKNIKNLRCPVCSLIMLTDEQIDEFVEDIQNKRGYELVDAFEKYEDDSVFTEVEQNPPKSIFRPQKQEIINILKELAKQNPNKSLSELTTIEAHRRIDELIATQLKIVDEIEEYVKQCNASRTEKAELADVILEFKNEILGKGDNQFSRKRFIYELSNISRNKNIQKGITEIAKKLPTSDKDINSWFVKYSKPAKAREIVKSFVQQSIPTAEHLQPKSKNGSNGVKNYICDCAECNSNRGNMDFDEWSKTIPGFKENLQSYLQDVQDAVDNSTISNKYNYYIENVIETIKKLSGGEIILDEPKSINIARRQRTLTKREQQIQNSESIIQKEIKERTTRRREIKRLKKHSYYKNLMLIKNIQEELQEVECNLEKAKDESTRKKLESKIINLKNRMHTCQQYIDDMDDIDTKIEQLENLIYSMNTVGVRYSNLQEEVARGEKLQKEQDTIIKENEMMEFQNYMITRNSDFNPKDTTTYNQYLEYKKILEVAENMYRKYDSASKKFKSEKTVTLIAIEAIKADMDKLLKDDRVIYFYNINKIKENKKLLVGIDMGLSKIENKKASIEEYSKQLQEIGKGRDLDELTKELDSMKRTKEAVSKIKILHRLESELNDLDQTISFNTKVLHELKMSYANMSNEEFLNKLNSIY